MRIVSCAVFFWDSVNYLCALMPISFAPFDPSISCASWIFLCSRNLSLLLRILDLSIFAHFGPFLFLRILNSINYDCPCIHFIVAHYGSFCCCAFWIQLIMTARVYILFLRNIFFSISRIFYIHHSSIRSLFFISHFFFFISIVDWSGPFAFREYHPSFHWSGLFAFREYHTSILSLIRAFFCTFLDLFIHFFLCASIFLHFGHWFTFIFYLNFFTQ